MLSHWLIHDVGFEGPHKYLWFNYMCMCVILRELTGILDQNVRCYDSCICRQLACSLAYVRAVRGESVCVPGGSKVACMLQQCLLSI
jgi:hypothetical protein